MDVHLPYRPPHISEFCVSQPAWTNVPKKSKEQNLIVFSGKSEVEVTNNRRLRSMYRSTEANYTQTQSIMWRLSDS